MGSGIVNSVIWCFDKVLVSGSPDWSFFLVFQLCLSGKRLYSTMTRSNGFCQDLDLSPFCDSTSSAPFPTCYNMFYVFFPFYRFIFAFSTTPLISPYFALMLASDFSFPIFVVSLLFFPSLLPWRRLTYIYFFSLIFFFFFSFFSSAHH